MSEVAGDSYQAVIRDLRARPRRWLVTGAAGFIGSNLCECLLELGQEVVGLDNFSTGRRENIAALGETAGAAAGRFRFIEGDICDLDTCREAVAGVAVVLHQAALGSVPRSIADPISTHRSNTDGFLNLLVAVRDAGVPRFVYAASSSTYGDEASLPKVEEKIGRPLSPYAVSKYVGELYAGVFHRSYGVETVGLRYFNVFGRRQDPDGPYAAVIPRWIENLFSGQVCRINGDGETSRDFCYIDNVLQANLLAATAADPAVLGEVYNIAYGRRTTLLELYGQLREIISGYLPAVAAAEPEFGPFAPGDVRHSLADLSKARRMLGYDPAFDLASGLKQAVRWYAASHRLAAAEAAGSVAG
jgi:UDP-N-acetylglucosamine 4-epimerase